MIHTCTIERMHENAEFYINIAPATRDIKPCTKVKIFTLGID